MANCNACRCAAAPHEDATHAIACREKTEAEGAQNSSSGEQSVCLSALRAVTCVWPLSPVSRCSAYWLAAHPVLSCSVVPLPFRRGQLKREAAADRQWVVREVSASPSTYFSGKAAPASACIFPKQPIGFPD